MRGSVVLGVCALAFFAAPSLRAQPAPEAVAEEPKPAFEDPTFGPRYLVEAVEVTGNRRTKSTIILREIRINPGDVLSASDKRVDAARLRLIALGYFLDARLGLGKGSAPGRAVLKVEVEERGTIVLDAIHLGTSEATRFWGGLDASEVNAFGRGIILGAGFVASTTPLVADAQAARAVRLRAGGPAIPGRMSLAASGLWSKGSEFFRVSGSDDSASPSGFAALNLERAGGTFGIAGDLGRSLRLFADARFERLRATYPTTMTPVDFHVREGESRVATAAATLDYDTRSDPVLPQAGVRVMAAGEIASDTVISHYNFAKAQLSAQSYHRLPWAHVLGFGVWGGAIAGDAPYFDRFFVGDLNWLLLPRALGINFATQPSRDLLGTQIASHRYDDFAARATTEYAVAIWRRHGLIYGGDAFAALGVFGMGSRGQGAFALDLTADVGLRLDTYIGVFRISVANGLGRLPL